MLRDIFTFKHLTMFDGFIDQFCAECVSKVKSTFWNSSHF